MTREPLHQRLARSAACDPARTAVIEPGQGAITYAELDHLSDRVRDRLVADGVTPGDRVAVFLPKSIDAVAAIFGILKTGAAYVPIDPGSPAWRAAFIINDCRVRAVLADAALLTPVEPELGQLGADPTRLVLTSTGGGRGLSEALDARARERPTPVVPSATPEPDALAYLLYTSGSTGRPKGVTLSHRAATSFVAWCSELYRPTPDDVVSSHAPFHFDLSILDLYLPLQHGATLVLIGEEAGKEPVGLAALIAEYRITMWYSTPSILALLAQYGRLERHDYGALRVVNFAGEVFPVPQLRAITRLWPRPRYFNLYGPTETNVCTWFEVPLPVPGERTAPYPIGRSCSHVTCRVVDPADRRLPPGEEGELIVSGAGIMSGYWNLPEQNARAFLVDQDGTRWYRTGDLVVEEPGGVYQFHGRRDRMVKRRGYRIELGDIEAALVQHPAVCEAAVVSLSDPGGGVRIKAFLATRDGARGSIIALKHFCVERLPRYMTPDAFEFLERLPRTSTDKTDYQSLQARA
jgi:L-proline---[L-prolyl-carrier protein] ligase